ncbi:MAG: thiazole synthase [Pseudomonadota bacterium]|nr:thiazole synthase [Pseudomonadota bacterium]
MKKLLDKEILIANKKFSSRLIIGTGKFESYKLNKKALEASKAEMITVAIRRVNLSDKNLPKLTDFISPKKYTFLPNTAGCFNAKEAIRTLRLAKDLGGWNIVKLEVLSDEKTLYPNMIETINASEKLVADGFKVLAYCNDDPILCKILEETGCSAIMPLGSPIGSGLGILNPLNIRLIIDQSKLPVILDAGIGTASDAVLAMELGCDAVLVNSAIAEAKDPVLMAESFRNAVIAGRQSYLAKRMKKKNYGTASSPTKNLISRS